MQLILGSSRFLGGIQVDGAAVFNETSIDVDFRVESNTGTHAFFIDGANGRIGIESCNS